MSAPVRFARLHLLTLTGFAVAQPLYDLIGRNTEFLVAHRAGPGTVFALVAILSVGIGAAIGAAVTAVRRSRSRGGEIAHLIAVALLGGLIVAGGARMWPAAAAVAFSLAAGIAFALLYRYQTVRTFLTLLTPSIVIFPTLFVAGTPVSQLIRPRETRTAPSAFRERPPIVVVVFDELSTFDVLDRSGAIDGRTFPALASFAATSTWFPNAVSPFPYSERAIPSILTGVEADGADSRLPIAADHPHNLFTWLAGPYALHVSEPISRLCPPALCGTDLASHPHVDARHLAIDTAVLYLHLVTPRDIAQQRLPSLAGTWQRFTTAGGAESVGAPSPETYDVVAAFERAAQPGRDTLFRRFIDGIDGGRGPALHFIHMLLPHDPYVFTPSGRRYAAGGLTTGMDPGGVWTKEQPLVDTGHERHIAQARLADRLLGELLSRLRSEALFDDALIVVTADHGAAFKAGESHRGMTESNAAEIVPVPLLVKLPRQRDGVISDRPVSGVDIPPTISGVLKAPLTWRHDGHDVFAAEYPARSSQLYSNLGVAAIPLLDVRAAVRRGDYGPSALARSSPAPGLLQTTVPELDALPVAPGMRVFSESFARLQNVTGTGLFPALVSGDVQFDDPHAEPVTLALAVNGTIAAVTRTVRWAGASHYFNVLLPETSIRTGANRLDVLQVDGRPDRPQTLARIADDFTRDMMLAETATGAVVTTAGGTRMPVHASVTGFVDRVQNGGSVLTLSGWAADVAAADPLRAIVAFSRGRAIAFTAPHADRPDVTAALSLRPPRKVSFALTIPAHAMAGPVRLFGVSARGAIGELQADRTAAAALSAR